APAPELADKSVRSIKLVMESGAKRGKGALAELVLMGLSGPRVPFNTTGPRPDCVTPVSTKSKVSVSMALGFAVKTSQTAIPRPLEIGTCEYVPPKRLDPAMGEMGPAPLLSVLTSRALVEPSGKTETYALTPVGTAEICRKRRVPLSASPAPGTKVAFTKPLSVL